MEARPRPLSQKASGRTNLAGSNQAPVGLARVFLIASRSEAPRFGRLTFTLGFRRVRRHLAEPRGQLFKVRQSRPKKRLPAEISVIVTAYNRREYLLQAIDSALKQRFPRSRYEVVVVKNFADHVVDSLIEREGLTSVNVDKPELGVKVEAGLKVSDGRIVSFLEDDDLFFPTKLERVARAFQRGLIYYHNARVRIDSHGRPLSEGRGTSRNFSKGFLPFQLPLPATVGGGAVKLDAVRPPPIPVPLSDVEKQRLAFYPRLNSLLGNVSCVSVARDFLQENIATIRQVSLSLDTSLYALALAAKGNLMVDPAVETLFRVHPSNTLVSTSSFDGFVGSQIANLERHIRDYQILLAAVGQNPVSAYLGFGLAERKVRRVIFRRAVGLPERGLPWEFSPTFRDYAMLLGNSLRWRKTSSVLYAALSLAPGAIKRAYVISSFKRYAISRSSGD